MKKLNVLYLLLLAAIAPPLAAQTLDLSDTGEFLDGIAAVVNDGIVMKSEVEAQTQLIVMRLQAEDTPLPPQDVLRQQILERLVVTKLQLQRAERLGIQVSDEMLNLALADIARRNNTTLSMLPQLLAQDGIEYAAYRGEMRDQIVIEQLRQRDVVSRIGISPRELEDFMEREEGKSYRSQQFRLSHILISLPLAATPEELAAAEARANDVYEKARAGEDFSQLAVSFSDGQNALDGGSMGWRRGDELPTLFAEVVPGMRANEVSEPIRSASGFHIIRVDEVKGAERVMEDQTHARHILIETDEILDDDAALQNLLEVREQILSGDDFAAIASAVSDDPTSAAEGGDLGWNGPDVFVPEFQAVCDSLEIGELSQPVQTQFGWHLIEVLERRTQDTTEEVERQRAAMAIRNSKLEEETELWLRRLRDEAFVEYRL